MCLIVCATGTLADTPLVVVANRDEWHGRPAERMHWWPDQPDILAGRDLQAGGTWFAVHRDGRFAAVTNYREHPRPADAGRSRGHLVIDYLASEQPATPFMASIDGERYAGFNLLVGDAEGLHYVSNRGDGPRRLETGVYGLSNAALDTPWWKLVRTRDGLQRLVDRGVIGNADLHELLSDRSMAPAADIDAGALPFDVARAQSAPFIVNETYGTRCTTSLIVSANGEVRVEETSFDAGGSVSDRSRFRFQAGDARRHQDA